MKTRLKLLLVGAFLIMTALKASPAKAYDCCLTPPYDGIYSEAACAQYCAGCCSYEFIGDACYCH